MRKAPNTPSSADFQQPRGRRVRIAGLDLVVIASPAPAPEVDPLAPLTCAEAEVARHALTGRSNRAIAAARGVSERTIANQLQSVFRKLGVRSRAELAARAARSVAEGKMTMER